MWDSTLQLIGTKQFSVLIIAQIIYWVGRCTALWCWDQEVSAAPRQKRHLMTHSCRVAKMFMGHLASKNQTDKQRQKGKDIETCN